MSARSGDAGGDSGGEAALDATSGPALKRSLGLGLLVFYGVGVMVGAGIYVLIGEVAARAGAWTPIAFLLAGLAAAVTAASFAELSARIPEAGGEAAYARAAFGSEGFSTAVGLAVTAVGLLSAGAVLQGGVGYLQAVLPLPKLPLVLLVGAALTAIAAVGVVGSLAFAAVLTCIEVAGLLIVVAVALSVAPVPPDPIAVPPAGDSLVAGLFGAVFLAFFAFIGFEDMVNMAEETRDPVRTLPMAIFLAFILVVAIYVAVAYAAVRAVGPSALADSDRPLALVYERATGQSPALIGLVGAAAALNGVLAQIVMAARVLFGLGRAQRPNGALAFFAQTHPRFRTPFRAALAAGAVVLLLAVTVPLAGLASATSLILIAVFVVMNVALIVLKRTPPPPGAPNLPRWVPYLGAAASLAVLAGAAL